MTLTLLVAAAAGSWMLFRLSQQPVTAGQAPVEDVAGYYLKDARILGTAEDGRMLYRVEADDVRHLPAEDSVHLTDVLVRYAGEGEADWTVSAREGRIRGTGEVIELLGDVKLDTAAIPATGEVTITTQTLFFSPREQIARTDDRVQIEQRGYVLTADGLEADLKKELVKLKSNVNGIFKP